MINVIDILHESHSGNLTCHAGEKSAGLLCVIQVDNMYKRMLNIYFS